MFIPFSCFDRILSKFCPQASVEKISKISVIAAVITSTILLSLKGIASYMSNSLALEASTIDSFIDAITSFFAFLAVRYSFKEADNDHGYGHGKIEGLTALFQMGIVIFATYNIFLEVGERFLNPEVVQPENQEIGIYAMIISSLLVYVLVSFQRYSAYKTNSMIVSSDSLHYSTDLLMNLGVLLSLFFSSYIKNLDAYVGIAVGLYVLVSAGKICFHSLQDLMDCELSDKDRKNIADKLKSCEEIIKVIRVRTRSAGTKRIVQADIILDKNLSLSEVEIITNNIANKISSLFSNSEVLIVPHPND